MKRILPYLLPVLLLLLAVALLVTGHKKSFDHRVTLNRKDKIPYGTFVTYQNLHHIFPQAAISINKKAPGYWDEDVLNYDSGKQVLIIICKDFNSSKDELQELFHFAEKGNDVFISSYDWSNTAQRFFYINLHYSDPGLPVFENNSGLDTLHIELIHPPFSKIHSHYSYPGRKLNSWFGGFDSSKAHLLGITGEDKPSFIRMRAGEGNFFIHSAPLALSNYFLLHKENMGYYNQLFSSMNAAAFNVIWDEYYLHKPRSRGQPNSSPLRVLMQQPSFRMALLSIVTGLVVFVLLGMKRKQRIIPVFATPQNDSLDFVKTIGRLYFQQGDHKNLCMKMSAGFTEYVYRQFRLSTTKMDEALILQLALKSGHSENLIRSIADYIRLVQEAPAISDSELASFYNLLEQFYKKL